MNNLRNISSVLSLVKDEIVTNLITFGNLDYLFVLGVVDAATLCKLCASYFVGRIWERCEIDISRE